MCSLVSACLEWTLRYIYGDGTLRARYCVPGYRPRGQFSEECRFEAHQVTVSCIHPVMKKEMCTSSPYASPVVFENSVRSLSLLKDISGYQTEAKVNGYDRSRLIDAGSPLPPRVHTAFTRWPFKWTEPRSGHDLGPAACSPLWLGTAHRREGAGWQDEDARDA
jgi:hypothetical protein